MTLNDAIAEIEQAGTLHITEGRLKLSLPEAARERLGPAIEVLRSNREAALDAIQNRGLVSSMPTLDSDEHPGSLDHKPISYAEWKAAELNRLFQEQGLTGQPGRITPETVRHGLEAHQRRLGSQ